MAQTIKLKRSATQGASPTTSQLELGEVAINTYDGKMYIKKNVGGTESIVEVGAGGGSGGGLSSSFTLYEYTATANQTTFSGSDSNSNTLAYDTGTPPKILVYLNGVLLDHTTDYTATNGTSVVLTSGAAANDLVQVAAYKSESSVALDIALDDDVKLKLGDDDDLQIYHDGSTNNSVIKETGSGNLELWGNNVKIMNVAGTETQLNANPNGQVELYYDNSKKLETTSSGIQVQGAMASTTGTYSPIYYGGSSSLQLKSNSGELFGQFTNNGAAELYYDNTKKFETTSTGATITGNIAVTGTVDGRDLATDGSKLDNIESNADVTDTANVTAAGALMDSEVTNLAQVKAFDSSDYATAAQGTTADSAMQDLVDDTTPQLGGNLDLNSNNITGTGNVNITGTVTSGNISVASITTSTASILSDTPFAFLTTSTAAQNIRTKSVFAGTSYGDTPPAGSFNATNTYELNGVTIVDSSANLTNIGTISSGAITATRSSSHTTGTISPSNATLDLYNSLESDTDEKGSIITFTDNYYDGGNYNKTTRAAIKGGTDTTGNTANGFLAFYTDSSAANTANERMRIDFNGNFDFKSGNFSNVGTISTSGTINGSQNQNAGYVHKLTNTNTGTSAYTEFTVESGTQELRIGTSQNYSSGQWDGSWVYADTGDLFLKSGLGHVKIYAGDTVNPRWTFNTDGSIRQGEYNGTTFVDSSRNITAGTISSGNITTSGTITFSNSHYFQAGTGNLFFKNSSNAALGGIDAAGFNTAYNYQISGTTVIDGSRNISAANITTTGYLRGPSTFTIDPATHGDDTGTVVIAGNLQVDGTTTTINSTTLTVDDLNITLASGSANSAAANGAGITVDIANNTNPTLLYNGALDTWEFNKRVDVTSEVRLFRSDGTRSGSILHNTSGTVVRTNSNGDNLYLQAAGTGNIYIQPTQAGYSTVINEDGIDSDFRVESDGNTHAFFVDAGNSRIGINTSSLTADGLVIGTNNNNCELDLHNTGSSGTRWRFNSGAQGHLQIENKTDSTIPFTLLDSGNVGIGSTNPGRQLTVEATSGAYIKTDSTSHTSWTIGSDAYGFVVYDDDVGGIEGYRIVVSQTSGNVGIGTTNPTRQLEIFEAGRAGAYRFKIKGDTGYTGMEIQNTSSNNTNILLRNPSYTQELYMDTAGKFHVYNNSSHRFTIDQSGNVGIGLTGPNAKLQVEELGIDTTTTSTSATTQVAIDTFAAATFRSARYTIQVTNSTDSTYHITEILLIHDGTTPQITEYGTIFTGSAEATFDADISSGNVRLLATPATTDSMTFKVVRHCITV